MSFNDKIDAFFASLNIKFSNAPAKHHLHLYADYIELVSLFSNNAYVSVTDILDRFTEEGIIKKKKSDSDRAEHNDKNEAWVNEIYAVILQRVSLYGTDYPFETLGNTKLRLKSPTNINNRNRIYIFLLLASCLSQFRDFEPELTKEFEALCAKALESFTPSPAIVKSFGKNSEYTGTAIEKIRALAGDLKVSVDDSFLNKFSESGNQERGLDIISWSPFDDDVPNGYLILFQCACGKDWYKKLTESRRYEHYYNFYCNKPQHGMFIPYSLINYQDSDFYQADEISVETLMFERKRILNYLRDLAFFSMLDSSLLVERCLNAEEDVV